MPFPFTCPYCGNQTLVDEQYIGQAGPCARCGRTVTVTPPGSAPFEPLGQNAAIRMLIPVGRSGWAIAAGYFGLFSILFFPAPLAVIFAIVAILDIKRHPEKHGMGRAIFGLVMGCLFSLLLVVTLVASAIK